MTNPASEEALGSLHALVATVLKQRVGDKDLCTAADINAAIKFLKDNNIQATRQGSKALDELANELGGVSVDEAGQAELDQALANVLQFPGSVANA